MNGSPRSGSSRCRGQVAVLGAGIMGSLTALLLARAGHRVTLFEAAAAPLQGASRWNEGKIHLGYLYAADPSLSTARHVLEGGLCFAPIVERLLGHSLLDHCTSTDDLYLLHRHSVVGAEAVAGYFTALTRELRQHPAARHYLADLRVARTERLGKAALDDLADPRQILAGYTVPERSVDTLWLADRLTTALQAEPRIELRLGQTVRAVRPLIDENGDWQVATQVGWDGPFAWVINALWQGKLAVDLTAGVDAAPGWSHRFRVSLFGRTRQPLGRPSAVVGFGPFGDVKNYDGRRFYLSWYPAGLLMESEAIRPEPPARINVEAVVAATQAGMGALVPWIREFLDQAESLELRGGWVFAQGRGSLADPRASLHRRDRFGVFGRGRYLSVDTGKFSSAPWLARALVGRITGRETAARISGWPGTS